MTTVKICTVDPQASFVTRVNGTATVDQLQHAEKDLHDNYDLFGIPPDVWEVEAKLFNDGEGAYFGNVRLLTPRAADGQSAPPK